MVPRGDRLGAAAFALAMAGTFAWSVAAGEGDGPPSAKDHDESADVHEELVREADAALAAERLERWQAAQVPAGMVFIPAGELEVPRGEPPFGPSGTRKRVGAFYMDRHETTVGEMAAWRAARAAREAQAERLPREAPEAPPMPAEQDPDLWPATGVSQREAMEYAREARTGRLPRAEEWERAVRGSSAQVWPWGQSFAAARCNLGSTGAGRLLARGLRPGGAGPFGNEDLVGNAAEWTSDLRPSGRGAGRWPVVVGGSWLDEPDVAWTWRGWLSNADVPQGDGEARPWIGFRVVRDVPRPPGERDNDK